MSRRRTAATARNPFASNEEPRIRLSVHEDFLEGTPWSIRESLMWRVDWVGFLSDTTPRMTVFAASMPLVSAPEEYSSLSVLVGTTVNIFQTLQSFQAAPTVTEGFARIQDMKHAAKKLARLAKGGDASESASEGMHLGPRTPALHAFLHELLQTVDAPDESLRADEGAWSREMAAYYRRDRRLRVFFARLDEIIGRLSISSEAAEELERDDPRQRRPGAPRDDAYDWFLARLMWIWRDALGRPVTIYMPRGAAEPLPDTLMAFVCAILNKLEPIRSNELSALEKKLIELRPKVPAKSLLFST
jgi:hypothetical protein